MHPPVNGRESQWLLLAAYSVNLQDFRCVLDHLLSMHIEFSVLDMSRPKEFHVSFSFFQSHTFHFTFQTELFTNLAQNKKSHTCNSITIFFDA